MNFDLEGAVFLMKLLCRLYLRCCMLVLSARKSKKFGIKPKCTAEGGKRVVRLMLGHIKGINRRMIQFFKNEFWL